MIRLATLADIPRIAEIGQHMHAESPRWRRLNYKPARVASTVRSLIEQPYGYVAVCEQAGEIIGGVMGYVFPHWFSDDLVAYEQSLFVLPEHRGHAAAVRLIRALQAWSKSKGAVFLQAGTSTGIDPERTAQLYERLGFTRCTIGLESFNG